MTLPGRVCGEVYAIYTSGGMGVVYVDVWRFGSSPGLTGVTGLTVTLFAMRTRKYRVLAEKYERERF